VVKVKNMSKIIVTEKQLEDIVKMVKENNEQGSYMAKQQLFTIATLAYKMWEMMEDGEQLEDWMETKIAQSEQSVTAVVKSFMYDDVEDRVKGNGGVDLDSLIIGM
jgi:nitrogen regulatory protein PII